MHRAGLGALLISVFSSAATAAYIPSLDGTSLDSTFEVGTATNLPILNWTNVSGAARAFDVNNLNGALIHATAPYDNYEVQYTSSTSIEPLKTYTLTFGMGFYGASKNPNPTGDYSFQLGTVDSSSVFTPLGSPKTGTVLYGGNIGSGGTLTTASMTYDTGVTVSGDVLAVRWAQTASSAGSDWFGFDNVRLEVESAPVPEPATLLLIPAAGVLLYGRRARRA